MGNIKRTGLIIKETKAAILFSVPGKDNTTSYEAWLPKNSIVVSDKVSYMRAAFPSNYDKKFTEATVSFPTELANNFKQF